MKENMKTQDFDLDRLRTLVCSLQLGIPRVRAMTDHVLAELADDQTERELGWRRAA